MIRLYHRENAGRPARVRWMHPEAELIAAPGTHERGQVYQWTSFAMRELEPALLQVYRAEQATDDAAKDRFTVADIVVGGVLTTARRLDLIPPASELNADLERLDSRPAKQKAYAQTTTE